MKSSFEGAAYPALPKGYKNRYPFKLSVPSFIYPDGWAANARMLGPYVDEVELLFLESKTDGCLPSTKEVETLSRISKDFSLAYNIHLPTDVSLAAPGREDMDEALDTLRRVIDLTLELEPTSYILHIPCDPSRRTGAGTGRWEERVRRGLEKLIAAGIPTRRMAVENLNYPFGWMHDLILDLDLSVCMDIGHLLLRREDITAFYRENADRIAVLHLHGVRDGEDHLPLTALSKAGGISAVKILKEFSGALSVEVFSFQYLVSSLAWLEEAIYCMEKRSAEKSKSGLNTLSAITLCNSSPSR